MGERNGETHGLGEQGSWLFVESSDAFFSSYELSYGLGLAKAAAMAKHRIIGKVFILPWRFWRY